MNRIIEIEDELRTGIYKVANDEFKRQKEERKEELENEKKRIDSVKNVFLKMRDEGILDWSDEECREQAIAKEGHDMYFSAQVEYGGYWWSVAKKMSRAREFSKKIVCRYAMPEDKKKFSWVDVLPPGR